jgi:hypothetical protein
VHPKPMHPDRSWFQAVAAASSSRRRSASCSEAGGGGPTPGQIPGQGVANGSGQLAEGQARCEGPGDVGPVDSFPVLVGYPERDSHPRFHSCGEQLGSGDPDELRVAAGHGDAFPEEFSDRDSAACQVEHPAQVPAVAVYDPFGQVANVDELHWVGRLAGGEDPAAGCDPPWPVGKTVGSVVRTYDQARPDDQAPLAERRRDVPLGRHLESSVPELRGHVVPHFQDGESSNCVTLWPA